MVTWATSGLGRAGAVAFGRAQASVIVNHLPGDDGTEAEVVREIEREGGRAAAIAADVSDEKHVQAMFEETVDRFGTVHVLVNNAGIKRSEEHTSELQSLMRKEYAVFRLIKKNTPKLRQSNMHEYTDK